MPDRGIYFSASTSTPITMTWSDVATAMASSRPPRVETICECCGRSVDATYWVLGIYRHMCNECIMETFPRGHRVDYWFCDCREHAGHRVLSPDADTIRYRDSFYFKTCAKGLERPCTICSKTALCTQMQDGARLCPECKENYCTCPGCGRTLKKADAVDGFCDKCQERTTHCGECGKRYLPGITGKRTILLCENCYAKFEGNITLAPHKDPAIREYHYEMKYVFYGDDPPHSLGLELEMSPAGNDVAAAISAIMNRTERRVWYCRDGSVSGGLELITHPHTFAEIYRLPWRETLAAARGLGAKSEKSDQICGLHVHVNKDYLGDNGWRKVATFVCGHNWPMVVAISRRRPEYISHYASRYRDASEKPLTKGEWNSIKSGECGRRYAVNMRTKYNTVEFRFFSGTLRHEAFVASLQFIEALLEFVPHIRGRHLVKGPTWSMLCGHLANARDRFGELILEMGSRGIWIGPTIDVAGTTVAHYDDPPGLVPIRPHPDCSCNPGCHCSNCEKKREVRRQWGADPRNAEVYRRWIAARLHYEDWQKTQTTIPNEGA